MTDAQKIDEGAIIDAKGDFEALNEWLEKIKNDIKNYDIKDPNRIYSGLALLSFGYFCGVRSDRRISWILQALSGAVFGFSAVQMLGNYFRKKEAVKDHDKPEKQLKHAHIIKDDQ